MPTVDQLTVVTLNTWKGDGQYRTRLELMGREIRACQPDVVLLQECFAALELGYDTAASLAASLDFYYEVWRGREKVRDCEGQNVLSTSGVAVLSRYPIRSRKVVDLPSDPRDGERAALFAEISHPTIDLMVSSIHLTHLQHAESLRRSQFQTMVAELSAAPIDQVVLIGGDFNAPSDAPEFLNNGTIDALELIDVRHFAGTPPRPTVTDSAVCIDHIMMRSAGALPPLNIRDVTLICNQVDAVAHVFPSDHFGVCAVFDLPLAT